jgi:hypothetical protein
MTNRFDLSCQTAFTGGNFFSREQLCQFSPVLKENLYLVSVSMAGNYNARNQYASAIVLMPALKF